MTEELLFSRRLGHISRKEGTLLDMVVPTAKLLQTAFQLVLLDVCHESERPHIDAADGHGILGIAAADAEEGAVAAEAQGKIRRNPFNIVDAAVRHVKFDGALARHHHACVPRRKKM